MGGALLNKIWGLPEKRISRADYFGLCAHIQSVLFADFPDRRVDIPRSVANKESYGDIDVLVTNKSNDDVNWTEYFKKWSGYVPHNNGGVISVPLDKVQCDFIFTSPDNFDCHYDYFSFETGNFVGNVATRIGFRYCHNGLKLKIPLSEFSPELPSHEYKLINITKNTKQIHDILGFDNEKFLAGFRSKEELFAWITGSRYFNAEIFQLESLNHQNRTRNSKRKTYREFLKLVEFTPPREAIDRNKLREEVKEHYPHILGEIEKCREEVILNKQRRAKFNGELVIELRALQGAALGDFIIKFKRSVVDFNAWIDSKTTEEIKQEIINYVIGPD